MIDPAPTPPSPPPAPEPRTIARPSFSREPDPPPSPLAVNPAPPRIRLSSPTAAARTAGAEWSRPTAHTRHQPADDNWGTTARPGTRPATNRFASRAASVGAPSPGLLVLHALPTGFHLYLLITLLTAGLGGGGNAIPLNVFIALLLTAWLHWFLRTANAVVRVLLLIFATVGNGLFALLYLLGIFAVLNSPYAALALLFGLFLIVTLAGVISGIYHENRLQQSLLNNGRHLRPLPKVNPEPELEIGGDWDEAKPRQPGRLPRR